MSTSEQFLGRREGIGLGIEATPGTAVAPQTFLRWLDNPFQNKTTHIENESAMGVVDGINDSEIVERWSEGSIGGKVTDVGVGFLFTGFFGSPTTTGSGTYTHTFQMSQSSLPTPALTRTRVNPLDTQRHAYGVVDSIELSAQQGGWVEVKSTIMARLGSSSVDTIALASEKEFTSKHVTVKLAADVASLAGATPLKAAKVTATLERKSVPFYPLGTSDDVEFDRGTFTAKGEVTLRLTDTQYETDYLANTIKAFQVVMTNGTSSVELNAGRVRYRELARAKGRDDIVSLTISFSCELDTSTGRQIQAIVKNGRATYQAA